MSLFLTDIPAWTYAGPEGSASGPRRPMGSGRPGGLTHRGPESAEPVLPDQGSELARRPPHGLLLVRKPPAARLLCERKPRVGRGWVAGGEKLAPSVRPS